VLQSGTLEFSREMSDFDSGAARCEEMARTKAIATQMPPAIANKAEMVTRTSTSSFIFHAPD